MITPFGSGSGMSYWLLLIGLPLLIGLWAQFRVSSAFRKWGEVRATSNITGAEAAREILQAAQIHDVQVVETNDFLGDHYDPTQKRLCLSTNVYNTPSVAALGIAAHETGHAIQHAKAYAPLKLRMAIVPITSIASQMLPFVIIGGLFFHITGLITLGIYCYMILLVFQLITLPVEFDASRRAKIILEQMGMVQAGHETAGVNRVLNAAALTYVAAFVATLGNLIYLFMVRDRD
jgi:Zn-dependent membrane protease YugP